MSKKEKGFAKGLKPYVRPFKQQYAITKDKKTLIKEKTLKNACADDKLRDDAYSIAAKSPYEKEYIYPYILISTIWVSPIEHKYANLSSEEVMDFYLKNYTDPYLYPKNFLFYQDILSCTGSVIFESTLRNERDWAYSKATIVNILSPELWGDDLFQFKELIIPWSSQNPRMNKIHFNYFDYVKAWDLAFCYDNSQRKHSWLFQFSEQTTTLKFPLWFVCWFSNWGSYPTILPNKIRNIFDDFVITNPSMNNHGLMFTVLYQVPWIVKWDVIITPRNISKLGVSFDNIPYLGRRIFIKWWDKFEFFKESVFSVKGLIHFEPSTSCSNLN